MRRANYAITVTLYCNYGDTLLNAITVTLYSTTNCQTPRPEYGDLVRCHRNPVIPSRLLKKCPFGVEKSSLVILLASSRSNEPRSSGWRNRLGGDFLPFMRAPPAGWAVSSDCKRRSRR